MPAAHIDGLDAPASAQLRAATAPAAATLGVTEAVHRAASLRGAGSGELPGPGPGQGQGPSASPTTANLVAAPAATAGLALPPPLRAYYDPLPMIAARRSVRRYRANPLPLQALAELLDAMSRPTALLSGAVRMHVVVHAVQGLTAGAWRYDTAAHALHPSASPTPPGRSHTRTAALAQDAAGDAAAVIVLTIDRSVFAADVLGAARGYRHAFLEAGMLGERLYLQAEALGLGVCAIGAFYDDDAAALINVDPEREWVVHFATLGWPA